MRTPSKRLTGVHVLLLVGATAYTTAALADDEKTPAPAAPTISDKPAPDTTPTVGPVQNATTQERTTEPMLEKPAPVVKPLSAREPTRTTMDKPLVDTYLRTWPEHSFKAARATIYAYGLPNEATPSMLVWIQNGPWLRTVIYKDEVVHDFPRTHYDVIEHVVQLQVPLAKVNDVLAFEGSTVIRRTQGTVAVHTANEPMSFLAINLVNDIVTGKKNVAAARKAYARGVVSIATAEPPVAATKLLFTPADDRAQDPDQPMMKNEYLEPGQKDPADVVAPPPPTPMPGPNDLRPGGGARPNDLNKAAPPKAPTKAAPPRPVPGAKNGPSAKK